MFKMNFSDRFLEQKLATISKLANHKARIEDVKFKERLKVIRDQGKMQLNNLSTMHNDIKLMKNDLGAASSSKALKRKKGLEIRSVDFDGKRVWHFPSEEITELFTTDGAIDISKIVCFHCLSMKVSYSQIPVKKNAASKISYITRYSKVLPNMILTYGPRFDLIFQGCIAVNDQMEVTLYSVLEVLLRHNPNTYSQLKKIARDPRQIYEILGNPKSQEYMRKLYDSGRVTDETSFRLAPCTINHLSKNTTMLTAQSAETVYVVQVPHEVSCHPLPMLSNDSQKSVEVLTKLKTEEVNRKQTQKGYRPYKGKLPPAPNFDLVHPVRRFNPSTLDKIRKKSLQFISRNQHEASPSEALGSIAKLGKDYTPTILSMLSNEQRIRLAHVAEAARTPKDKRELPEQFRSTTEGISSLLLKTLSSRSREQLLQGMTVEERQFAKDPVERGGLGLAELPQIETEQLKPLPSSKYQKLLDDVITPTPTPAKTSNYDAMYTLGDNTLEIERLKGELSSLEIERGIKNFVDKIRSAINTQNASAE